MKKLSSITLLFLSSAMLNGMDVTAPRPIEMLASAGTWSVEPPSLSDRVAGAIANTPRSPAILDRCCCCGCEGMQLFLEQQEAIEKLHTTQDSQTQERLLRRLQDLQRRYGKSQFFPRVVSANLCAGSLMISIALFMYYS